MEGEGGEKRESAWDSSAREAEAGDKRAGVGEVEGGMRDWKRAAGESREDAAGEETALEGAVRACCGVGMVAALVELSEAAVCVAVAGSVAGGCAAGAEMALCAVVLDFRVRVRRRAAGSRFLDCASVMGSPLGASSDAEAEEGGVEAGVEEVVDDNSARAV